MCLEQMARRCPNSVYVGTATLRHFRWIINERGYANVVRSNGDWVEGLVFLIDSSDERRLDKSEGVHKLCVVEGNPGLEAPCYKKTYETLIISRPHKALYRQSVSWIVEKGGPASVLLEAQKEGLSIRKLPSRKEDNVLIYNSPIFVRNGSPKEEYMKRINNGVVDARALGMTSDYISRFIRVVIPPDGSAKINARSAQDRDIFSNSRAHQSFREANNYAARRGRHSIHEFGGSTGQFYPAEDYRPDSSRGTPRRTLSLDRGHHRRTQDVSFTKVARSTSRRRSENLDAVDLIEMLVGGVKSLSRKFK